MKETQTGLQCHLCGNYLVYDKHYLSLSCPIHSEIQVSNSNSLETTCNICQSPLIYISSYTLHNKNIIDTICSNPRCPGYSMESINDIVFNIHYYTMNKSNDFGLFTGLKDNLVIKQFNKPRRTIDDLNISSTLYDVLVLVAKSHGYFKNYMIDYYTNYVRN